MQIGARYKRKYLHYILEIDVRLHLVVFAESLMRLFYLIGAILARFRLTVDELLIFKK